MRDKTEQIDLQKCHRDAPPPKSVPGTNLPEEASQLRICNTVAALGTVFVTGASGRVGGALVEELTRRGMPVRAGSRRPERLGLAATGVEAIHFDFEQPATFAPALSGVDLVFLVARPGDERSDLYSMPFLDEAVRQGVRHVVNLTAMGVETMPSTSLRKIELHLEASGLAFTHLRPNFFMQTFAHPPLVHAVAAGAIRVPAAGARLSFIDARDIAAVAAVVLTEPGHAGKAYTLTGAEAVDHEEAARHISVAAAREVRYEPIEEGEARTALEAAGFPPSRVERLVGFYRLVRGGFCARVSPTVEAVLGRPPISFAQFAHDYAEAWTRTARLTV